MSHYRRQWPVRQQRVEAFREARRQVFVTGSMIYWKKSAEDHVEQTHHEHSPGQGTEPSQAGVRVFLTKYGPAIGMAVLIGYIILLGIGVFAEVFKVQWILDWWIWSPPGKFK